MRRTHMSGVQYRIGRFRPWVVALAAALGTVSVHAALFGDDEARRAILELRQLRTQDNDAQKDAQAALSAQVEQLKRSLLEMNAQLEQMRADMARQRGHEEVLSRELAELQRRVRDAQVAQDERFRRFEPQTVTTDGKTFQVMPEERKLFEDALARLKSADFAAAAASLNTLLQSFPNTGYRESAWYWLGNAHYGLRAYRPAMEAFKRLVDQAPDHTRAPEAMLSLGNCHLELKESATAREVLARLVKQYPQTEAAQAASDRLKLIAKAK